MCYNNYPRMIMFRQTSLYKHSHIQISTLIMLCIGESFSIYLKLINRLPFLVTMCIKICFSQWKQKNYMFTLVQWTADLFIVLHSIPSSSSYTEQLLQLHILIFFTNSFLSQHFSLLLLFILKWSLNHQPTHTKPSYPLQSPASLPMSSPYNSSTSMYF